MNEIETIKHDRNHGASDKNDKELKNGKKGRRPPHSFLSFEEMELERIRENNEREMEIFLANG